MPKQYIEKINSIWKRSIKFFVIFWKYFYIPVMQSFLLGKYQINMKHIWQAVIIETHWIITTNTGMNPSTFSCHRFLIRMSFFLHLVTLLRSALNLLYIAGGLRDPSNFHYSVTWDFNRPKMALYNPWLKEGLLIKIRTK